MEEYHQITLNEWMDMKDQLRRELNNVRQSYIRVGYVLRRMEDTRAYEAEGYKSVAEFAEKEHGLKPSTTSRWMSINREYSLDGYSMQLDPRYIDMNASQLTEMLGLPMEDRDMIRPETKREDIRELKRMEKEPEAESDLAKIVRMFFGAYPEVLKEAQGLINTGADVSKVVEAVNPSGSRSFRKNGMMLMMYEDSVKFKAAGHSPVTVDWSEILGIAAGIEIKDEGYGLTEEDADEREEGTDRAAADEERPEEAGAEAQEGSGEEGPASPGMDDERGTEEGHEPEGKTESAEGSGAVTEGNEDGGADDGESGERSEEPDPGRSGGAGTEEAGGPVSEGEVPEAEDDEDGSETAGDVPEVPDDLIAPAQNLPEEDAPENIVDEEGNPSPNPSPDEEPARRKQLDPAQNARNREICWKNMEKLINLFNQRDTAGAVKQCEFVLKCLKALLKTEQ